MYFLLVLESLSGSEMMGICLEQTGLAPGEFQRVGLFGMVGTACESYKELMADGGEFLAADSIYGGNAMRSEAQSAIRSPSFNWVPC